MLVNLIGWLIRYIKVGDTIKKLVNFKKYLIKVHKQFKNESWNKRKEVSHTNEGW